MLNLGLSIPSHRPSPASGATGILDAFPGAAFAIAPDTLLYGNHSVTDNAAGSQTNGQADTYTVRVRRSSDNAVRSFNHTEVSDGTLVTWAGAGNDGFVETAYDQSGNANHATQSTAANQPKIVDSGNLVVENGKAALDFDGVDDYLTTPISTNYEDAYTEIAVAKSTTTNLFSALIAHSDGTIVEGGYLGTRSRGANWGTFDDGEKIFGAISGNLDLVSRYENGTTISNYVNTIAGVTYTSNEQVSPALIGIIEPGHNSPFLGRCSSILFWGIDQSANRTDIETAINNEYNIY